MNSCFSEEEKKETESNTHDFMCIEKDKNTLAEIVKTECL